MERPETRVHRQGPFPVRFRELEVIRTQPLGPHLMRVTLGGPDLEGFRTLGPDDHVKLCFPSPATGELVVPRPGPGGLTWPEGHEKPPLRDYTPRKFDPVRGELDIDFVMHGDGPAASWARHCQAGHRLGVGGPRGSMTLVPDAFDGFVLLGDMTALPAIFRRIEEAPLALPIVAVIEVDTEADELPVETQARLSLRWVHRRGQPAGGSPLLDD
jgi:NADPH-dependent ferric siderophore reductase